MQYRMLPLRDHDKIIDSIVPKAPEINSAIASAVVVDFLNFLFQFPETALDSSKCACDSVGIGVIVWVFVRVIIVRFFIHDQETS